MDILIVENKRKEMISRYLAKHVLEDIKTIHFIYMIPDIIKHHFQAKQTGDIDHPIPV